MPLTCSFTHIPPQPGAYSTKKLELCSPPCAPGPRCCLQTSSPQGMCGRWVAGKNDSALVPTTVFSRPWANSCRGRPRMERGCPQSWGQALEVPEIQEGGAGAMAATAATILRHSPLPHPHHRHWWRVQKLPKSCVLSWHHRTPASPIAEAIPGMPPPSCSHTSH